MKGLNGIPRHCSTASLVSHQTTFLCFPVTLEFLTCWYLSPPSLSVCDSQVILPLAMKRTFQKWIGVIPNIPDFLLQRDKKENKLHLSTESCGDTGQDQNSSSLCCISEFDGLASQLSSLQMHLLSISRLKSSGFCFLLPCYVSVIPIYYISNLWQGRILKND